MASGGFGMTDPTVEVQRTVVLTAHPLQRVGAFALGWLAGVNHPDRLGAKAFDEASAAVTEAMVEATGKASGNDEGAFFLKVSHSFFPNSPMNHPARAKAGKNAVAGVRSWQTMPEPESWPGVSCALCGRDAVGFYGNSDMALAASASHRNTVPDGHSGTALCWPCVTSFHALPFGCRLTGGSSTALHSYDDDFLSDVVELQVRTNRNHITLGQPVAKGGPSPKADAMDRLRAYERRLATGVELLVFTNYNGKAALQISKLDHPTALWLRSTRAAGADGWRELCQAHGPEKISGTARLASSIFDHPRRVISTTARHLLAQAESVPIWKKTAPNLAPICRTYVLKVLMMKPIDEERLRALGHNIAAVIYAENSAGRLKAFRSDFNDSRRRRSMLQRMAVDWLLDKKRDGALLTADQLLLLLDHENSWLHRDYLTITIFERLAELGYNPHDADEVAEESAAEPIRAIEENSEGDM